MSQDLFAVLFVDRSDTFRAPLAAALLRHELETHGHTNVIVSSAGIRAETGRPVSPYLAQVVPSLMVDSLAPTAKRVTDRLVESSHLILALDGSQAEWLLEQFPRSADRIRTLGRFEGRSRTPDIPQVAGETLLDYQSLFHRIERCVLGLVAEWEKVIARFFVRRKLDVAVGADHRGFAMKKEIAAYLEKEGYRVVDCGAYSSQASDHPLFAIRVGEMVAREEVDRGILICGSGLGMSISANKVHGVRAAMCINPDHAALSRTHNNANVLCLAADCFPQEQEIEIVRAWMTTPFLGGKYQRRNNIISHYEEKNQKHLSCEKRSTLPSRVAE